MHPLIFIIIIFTKRLITPSLAYAHLSSSGGSALAQRLARNWALLLLRLGLMTMQ